MSKKVVPAAPWRAERIRAIFLREGRLRLGWAAALCCALFALAAWAAPAGLGLLFSRLLALWGVTGRSLPYAPGWVRTLVGSWTGIAAIGQGLLCFGAVALCARTRGRSLEGKAGHWLAGGLLGAALAAVAFALLRGTDSVRAMAAQGPGWAAECVALCAAAASALAPEALVGGFLWPETERLRPWLRVLLFVLADALLYLPGTGFTPLGIGAAAAMALCCAALCFRLGWAAGAGLRALWHFTAHRALGFSADGTPGIRFETFPVARDWLTGGDAGLEAGCLALLLFAAAAAAIFLCRPKRRRPNAL